MKLRQLLLYDMSNILWYERFHTAWILRMAGLLNSGVTDDASFLRVVVLSVRIMVMM